MRRFALCIAILTFATTAFADWAPDNFTVRTWSESQALTRAVPTTDATLGMSLYNVVSFYVLVTPPVSQSLSGGGEIDLYAYEPLVSTSWFQLPSTLSLASCAGWTTPCPLPLYGGGVMRGRIMAVTKSVTVSSGSAVTVTIVAQVSGRSMSY